MSSPRLLGGAQLIISLYSVREEAASSQPHQEA